MLSTPAASADEGEPLEPDASSADVDVARDEADHGAAHHDEPDAFLDTVRALVRGEPSPGSDARSPRAAVQAAGAAPAAEERLDHWLPGTWAPEPESRRARRAARKAEQQALEHERKLDRAERRSLRARHRTAGRAVEPAVQPAAQPVEQPVEAPDERLLEQPLDAVPDVTPDVTPDVMPDAMPQRIPVQADGRTAERGTVQARGTEGAEAPVSRRERRRRRRHEAAREIAVAVPTDGVAAEPRATTVTVRRVRRRERRRQLRDNTVAAPSDTLDDVADVESPSVPGPPSGSVSRSVSGSVSGPVSPVGDRPGGSGGPRPSRGERRLSRTIAQARARGESGVPPLEPETLAEYVARVDAGLLPRRSRRSRPRTPRWARRTTRITLVVAVIGVCVALPWVAPSVPQAISDLLPDNSAPVRVADPPVAPPADAFVGPIGVVQQAGPLAGVRLQAAGEPREVRVPRLHVNSDVVPISGQSGSLLPPSDPQLLGWWQEGRWTGAGAGTAVVTGHTVHTGGGALDQLDKLVVGDEVRVRTDNGWIRYVVQRTRIYSTEALARDADVLFRLEGPARLVLITCDDWNGSFYESNAVVFATPVEDLPTVS